MDKEELLKRIEKKQKEIEKREKAISKLEDGLSTQDKVMALNSRGTEAYQKYREYVNNINDWNRQENISNLRRAYIEVDENRYTLGKYNNELTKIINREKAPRIKIFMDFLERYKQEVIKYIYENVKVYLEYFEVESKACEMYNHSWQLEKDGMSREEIRHKQNELRNKAKALRSQVHPYTEQSFRRSAEGSIDSSVLNKLIDKEIENKYWNMVEKVTEITGEVTDASNLSIGYDGNINGIIIGEEGKAKLETIGAGGYNQDIIVNVKHGQCYHFRLLVHKVK